MTFTRLFKQGSLIMKRWQISAPMSGIFFRKIKRDRKYKD